ncbi:hypothetical protein DERF_005689 [Dermatophagoides farinae]|uniref:Uncharacterized protein n=1 Tax=Dermatophagoides farinae TaxID=6954 RepID=A0A922L6F5_DERFA|nr:hypothetical protein DERF_005689 [Dermatophagoides farinae]
MNLILLYFETKHYNLGVKTLIPFKVLEYIGEYREEIKSINAESGYNMKQKLLEEQKELI